MFKIYIVKYIINRQFYVQNLRSKKKVYDLILYTISLSLLLKRNVHILIEPAHMWCRTPPTSPPPQPPPPPPPPLPTTHIRQIKRKYVQL